MQKLSKYLPIILAVIGTGAMTNAGIVFNASQSGGENIKLWIEAIVSLLFGLPSLGYVAKRAFTGTGNSDSNPDAAPTFSESMAAIQVLSEVCDGCEEADQALETLTVHIVKRLHDA